ncbi:MAG: hypothetical protein ACHQD8_07550, partial [Chitinophagales bacterium]
MNVKSLFILILLAASYGARGQRTVPANDTVMKGATIEVIQSYKPKVRQAPKPAWIPQLPPADTTHPAFSYDVPQQTLYYSYSSLPLRPLALGRDTITLPFQNYVKAGGGNLSTLFLDAGIGSISGPGYETAIHLHHLSQKGNIKYQQSALSGIDADAMLHKDNSEWHIGVMGERDQYYHYGFENNQGADSLKQTYTTARLCVDMKNKADSAEKLNYHPAINVSYYAARFNTSEVTVGFDAPVTYKFDPAIEARVALKGAITNYSVNSVSTSNNIIELLPGINIHKDELSGHALLGFALGLSTGMYVLPDILATYQIPDTKFTVSGGWQASLRQNTYEQLSTENPYIYNTYHVLQTRKDEIFAQILSSSGDHLTYSGRLSWWSFDQLPAFLNDIGNEKQFYVVYDRVNAVSLQAGARYQVANIWSVGITGDFYVFNNGSLPHVWHEPNTKIKCDFIITPLSQLTVTAYLALLGGIYAKDIAGNIVKLDMIADAGCNAEYQFIPRLSAFVQVNNLFNDKYQRWRGYQVYGLNIYGG